MGIGEILKQIHPTPLALDSVLCHILSDSVRL